jgi:diaminohydroxyphosphoribosylaminopyrimidine deaminase/5-amino-6-(5-phosphoribosylamino)uracil reductase
VIDNRLDMPLTAKILSGEPPLILTVSEDHGRRAAPRKKGAEVVGVRGRARSPISRPSCACWRAQLQRSDRRDGGKLMGSLLRARLIDELVLYLAPMIPRRHAQALFVLPEIASLDERCGRASSTRAPSASDWRITARFGQ